MPCPGRERAFRALQVVLLLAFAFALAAHHGRRGYMPLDHSIVFDGGWRILCGQVPFRDFHTPNGIAPCALQAGFFGLLGVTWQAYVVHAALANALFAWLVHALAFRLGLPRGLSLSYGAASAVLLYPPIGVPYMDPHAFLFSLAAVVLAVHARRRPRESAWPWLLVPGVLLLAGLSKQIPSAFAVPIVAGIALAGPRGTRLRRLLWLAAGTAACAAALVALGWALGVDGRRFWDYFVDLPAEEGRARLRFVPTARDFLGRVAWFGVQSDLWSVESAHGLAAAALAGATALLWRSRGEPSAREQALRSAGRALLGEALVLVCAVFLVLTSNQPAIAAALVFAGLACSQAAVLAVLPGAGSPASRALRAVVLLGPLVPLARDAWSFEQRINRGRALNDLVYDEAAARAARPDLPEPLSFLRWAIPARCGYTPLELRQLAGFLRSQPEGFLLFGDSSILYALAGKPSTAPSLWFHPGLTLPPPEDPRREQYDRWLVDAFERGGARYLVVEGEHTWVPCAVTDFPRLHAYVGAHFSSAARFGPFKVVDLR